MSFHYMYLDLNMKNLYFQTKRDPNQPVSSATEILSVSSLDMLLPNKPIIKVLMQAGLRLCCSQTLKTGFLALGPI